MASEIIKKVIEQTKKKQVFFTKHCLDKLKDRGLIGEKILLKLKSEPIGFLEQDKNTFKLIYPYNDRYNLSIIIRINGNMQIITAFIHLKGRYL